MKRHEEILHEAIAYHWNNTHLGFAWDIQRLICNWNNGETGRAGVKMVAMGVKKGVADWQYMMDNGKTKWIELKTDVGLQSKEQKQFQQLCLSLQHEYVICRTWADFWTELAMDIPEIPKPFATYSHLTIFNQVKERIF